MSKKWWLSIALLVAVSACQNLPSQDLHLEDGVYWSALYQAYLEVEDNTALRYQWTPAACFPADAGLIPKAISPESPAGQHRWLDANKERLVLQRHSDGLPVLFTRIKTLPSSCKTAHVDTTQINLEVLRLTLEQFHHHLNAKAYHQLSLQLEPLDTELFKSGATTDQTLFDAFSNVLDSSNDQHAFLRAPNLQRYHSTSRLSLDEAQRQVLRDKFIRSLERSSMRSECQGALWHGQVSREQYYVSSLRLHSLTVGSSYDPKSRSCLQRAIRKIERGLQNQRLGTDRKPELIVDLRYNEGGSLLLASQLAHSLKFSDEPLAYIGDQPISVRRPPNLDRLYRPGPVLMSEITASAAEHLARALELRGFTLTGEHTRGAFSPTTVRSLPNGWIMGLSMYAPDMVLDGTGKPLPEQVGLTPECRVVFAENHQLILKTECLR